ncbi:hypothetical protein CBR_g54237 [Chara braunii]|uniref:Acetyltransferase component of pyruvate dehydrogenase complex n=1 Tax=Chara braunii TaxID=69332 RepID=A0A388K7D5_CHABU|nr:hypothetical protein CBR_g54237 [Chara braunii]|eukprot:GBG65946.1 hypothetical protein CBR_g54237 [Chara braunii]
MAARRAADVAGTQLRRLLVYQGGACAAGGGGFRAGARERNALLRGPSAIAGVRKWAGARQGVTRGYASCVVVSGDDLAFPPYQEVAMPALSPTMSQGNLAKWRLKEGDKVGPGDVLCEIETDKATLDMESQEEGYLAKILVPDGTANIPVGKPIAIMVEEEEYLAKFADFVPGDAGAGAAAAKPEQPPPPPPSEAPAQKAEPIAPPPPPPPSQEVAPKAHVDSGDRIFISPAAKKLALENAVDLSSIKGSGPDGRVVRADVEEFLATKGDKKPVAAVDAKKGVAAVVDGVEYTDIPHTQIRKITASRLLMSKQTIPHYYLSVDACLDRLNEVRAKLNAKQAETGGKKLSINDFVIKATALALRRVPEVNSSWQDDVIRQYHNIDVTVAVQTDAGLMVPFVKNADKKGVAAISEEVRALADKAKQGKLKPSEFQGGTFTISNLGMFGIKQFAAIVNPPQAAILAVGAGAVGAQWLQAFKSYIEDPMTMLL